MPGFKRKDKDKLFPHLNPTHADSSHYLSQGKSLFYVYFVENKISLISFTDKGGKKCNKQAQSWPFLSTNPRLVSVISRSIDKSGSAHRKLTTLYFDISKLWYA